MSELERVDVVEPARLVIPDEVCEAFLEALSEQPGRGHVGLLRELGVEGRRGELREAINAQLAESIRLLRGDRVRSELLRRGVDGWDEPVYQGGKKVGTVRKHSDACLIKLAEWTLPEARNQLDVNLAGADGGAVRVEVDDGRVATISGVLALAAQLGVAGAQGGLGAAVTRRALPAAEDVLPDPAVDQ